MALNKNGELYGWGIDIAGELIYPLSERDYKVKLMDEVVSAGIGANHCTAVKSDGTLWTWGRNWTGQLATGPADAKIYPPQKIMEHMAAVYLHDNLSFAVDKNGKASRVCQQQARDGANEASLRQMRSLL